MAADTRPFKSKEQDGQGNEVIIRDQQLVEQASQTTMASGEYFEIVDVDGRMAKIPKANMMSVVLEAIRLLLDDSGSNISAANLTKILGLSASSIGNILPADLASVLGGHALYDGGEGGLSGAALLRQYYLHEVNSNIYDMTTLNEGIYMIVYGTCLKDLPSDFPSSNSTCMLIKTCYIANQSSYLLIWMRGAGIWARYKESVDWTRIV